MTKTPDKKPGAKRGTPFGPDNPPPRRGRPKGARNLRTIVQALANETVAVQIDGKRKKRRIIELVLRALNAKSLKGDLRAVEQVDRIRERFGAPSVEGGLLVVPETESEVEWKRTVEFHYRKVIQPDPMDID